MSPELFFGVLASLRTSRSSRTEELRMEEEVRVLMARVLEEALSAGDAEAPPSVRDEFTKLAPAPPPPRAFSLLCRPEMEAEVTLGSAHSDTPTMMLLPKTLPFLLSAF